MNAESIRREEMKDGNHGGITDGNHGLDIGHEVWDIERFHGIDDFPGI